MDTRVTLVDGGGLGSALGEALAVLPGWHCQVVPEAELAAGVAGEEGGGPDAVVFVPRRHPAPRVDSLVPVLEALEARSPAHLVVLSSTEVYPAHHHHPGFAEEAVADQRPDRNEVAAAWLALERAVTERGEGPAPVRLTVLRPAPVPRPGGEDRLSRLLSRRFAFTIAGHDPSLQLLALEDLVAAVRRVVEAGLEGGPDGTPWPGGTFNVVPAGTVPLRKALRLAGVRRLALPAWALRWAHGDGGDYLRYPWTAGGEAAARELGWTARRGSAAAVLTLARSLGRRPRRAPATAVAADRPVTARERAALRRAPRPSIHGTGGDGAHRNGSHEVAHEAAFREPRFDPFGMDPHYIEALGRTLFRVLHDGYWRVEHRGLDRVPRHGGAVLTGVHRGFMPFDGVMTLHLLASRLGRYPRFLLHPTLLKFPFLFDLMTRLGGIPANRANAARILGEGGLLAIYPEGIRGAFTPYRRAYRLGRFGRDEYVRFALLHRVPIVPFVTVGSAEIYPILGRLDWSWWKRYSEWPYLPLTPTFPWLPVPLPSKWHTRFLEPIHVEAEYPPEAAEDREVVAALSRRVRESMQYAIDDLRRRRPSIWWGSIPEDAEAGDAATDPGPDPDAPGATVVGGRS